MRQASFRGVATTAALIIGSTGAFAGGIERNPQSMNILFEQGNYLEFGATYGRPRVSGDLTAVGGGASGNIARSFFSGSLAFKSDINDTLSYAIILDQPFGADTLYPSNGSFFDTLSGSVENTTLTGVLRYKFDGGFSAYAGLRSSWTSGAVNIPEIPTISPAYTLSTNTDQAFGYLAGVAYERPDIALRVALTYNSKIKHGLSAVETVGGAPFNTTFTTNLPQSVNLEFQSGVAEDTLVFGSVRWVNWKDFEIAPPTYMSAPGADPLVEYLKNSTTYTLGVGRRFNEIWAGQISVSHDTGNGKLTGNLGPVGTRNSIGLGLSYTQNAMTISGGVQYSRLGNATTVSGSEFSGNSAVGAGIRVGYRF